MLFLLAEDRKGRGLFFFHGTADLLEDTLRYHRIQQGIPSPYGFQGMDQILAVDLFEQIAGSPGTDRGKEHLIFRVGRQHDNPHFGI